MVPQPSLDCAISAVNADSTFPQVFCTAINELEAKCTSRDVSSQFHLLFIDGQLAQLHWNSSLHNCGNIWTLVPLNEPYPMLNGGEYGPSVAWSPDPLVSYRWQPSVDPKVLQITMDAPSTIFATTTQGSFTNTSSLINATQGSHVNVLAPGDLVVEFAVECAGWLEMQTVGLGADVQLEMSISEVSLPSITQSIIELHIACDLAHSSTTSPESTTAVPLIRTRPLRPSHMPAAGGDSSSIASCMRVCALDLCTFVP